MTKSRLKKISEKPIRMCYTLHVCTLCNKYITLGEKYHDGGGSMRAHIDCVNLMMKQIGEK